MNNIIEWLESPEGEAWSQEVHHLHKFRDDDNWAVPRFLVSIKDDDMPCDIIGGLLVA